MFQVSLSRATKYCVNVFDFANELSHIQLSFQHNQFSQNFINTYTELFFKKFHLSTLKIPYGEANYDHNVHDRLRCHVTEYHLRQKRTKM